MFYAGVSGLIFYYLFSWMPERKRKKQIRVKLERNICDIYKELTNLFLVVTDETYGIKIRSGNLSEDDILHTLMCKAYEDEFIEEIDIKLDGINEPIRGNINRCNILISKTLLYNEYLETKEINVLEDISFDLMGVEKFCGSKIHGYVGVYDLNRALPKLYERYVELAPLFTSYKIDNKHIIKEQIAALYFSDKFLECKKNVERQIKLDFADKSFIYTFQILLEYKLENKDELNRFISLNAEIHIRDLYFFIDAYESGNELIVDFLTDKKSKRSDDFDKMYKYELKRRNDFESIIDKITELNDKNFKRMVKAMDKMR